MHFYRLILDENGVPTIRRSAGEITISLSTTPLYGDLIDTGSTQTSEDKMDPPLVLGDDLTAALQRVNSRNMVIEFFTTKLGVKFFVSPGGDPEVGQVQKLIQGVLNAHLQQLAA